LETHGPDKKLAERSNTVKYIILAVILAVVSVSLAQSNQQPQSQSSQLLVAVKMDYSKPQNIEIVMARANAGDAYYQGLLALYYYRGYLVKEDKALAEKWAKLSADKGHPFGLYCFGAIYVKQSDISEKYFKQSIDGMTSLARAGDAEAQYNLGACYANGAGITKDLTRAMEWLQKAVEQGLAGAQFKLGLCYYKGEGIAKDLTKAVELYRKAAEQGHAEAQERLKELNAAK